MKILIIEICMNSSIKRFENSFKNMLLCRNITQTLKDDTILIVIGDHGMTGSGDHGGESPDEISSALFIYSKTPLTKEITKREKAKVVKQVDLVPTLSSILGVPIPYANLGSVVLSALPIMNVSASTPAWKLSLNALWSNVQQMTSYIKDYTRGKDVFDWEKLQYFYERFSVLNARSYVVHSEAEFLRFAEDAVEYTTSLRGMCEEVWVQFDSFSMARGLLLMFLIVTFVYMIVDGVPSDRLPEIFQSSFLTCSYGAVGAAAALTIGLYASNFLTNIRPNVYFASGIVSVFMMAVLVVQNWEVIALNWYEKNKSRNWVDVTCRLVLLLATCVLFSNSFIVEEAKVLLFLIVSLIVITLLDIIAQKSKSQTGKPTPFAKSSKAKALIVGVVLGAIVRLSIGYLRCREEQQWCVSATHNVLKSDMSSGKAEWAVTLLSLACLVTLSRMWLRNCGNLVGVSPTVFLARYSPTVLVVCVGGFWVLHRLPKDAKSKMGPWQADMLAWVVYASVALGFVSIFWRPLCVYVLPKKRDIDCKDATIPALFKKVKGMFGEENAEPDEIPIVCGLATVYSAVFVVAAVYFTLLLALLLGDGVAPSAVLLFFAGALVLVLSAISRYEKATTVGEWKYLCHLLFLCKMCFISSFNFHQLFFFTLYICVLTWTKEIFVMNYRSYSVNVNY